MKSNKKEKKPVVLVCPLSWGLGHATRSIPVINILLEKQCMVYIAGSKEVITLLEKEFDQKANYILFEGINIRYGKKTFLNLIIQTPGFIINSFKEHYKLKKLIRFTGADIVISDNRYGLWSKNVYTVFITHQLNIKLPAQLSYIQKPLRFIIRRIIRNYNALWIPDTDKKNNFAGELTDNAYKYHSEAVHLGLLSRFSNKGVTITQKDKTKFTNDYILCIISGPEPQRTFFENKLISQLQEIKYNSIMLRGVPGKKEITKIGKCTVYNHTNSMHFAELIAGEKLIICRSGYSTLMDISFFGSKTLLVPTPGQPEQEYLAKLFNNKKWSYYTQQNEIDLTTDINTALLFDGIPKQPTNKNKLDFITNSLIEKITKSNN